MLDDVFSTVAGSLVGLFGGETVTYRDDSSGTETVLVGAFRQNYEPASIDSVNYVGKFTAFFCESRDFPASGGSRFGDTITHNGTTYKIRDVIDDGRIVEVRME